MPAGVRIARLREALRRIRSVRRADERPEVVTAQPERPEELDTKERLRLADQIAGKQIDPSGTPAPVAAPSALSASSPPLVEQRPPASASKPSREGSSPAPRVDTDELPSTQPIPVRRPRTSPLPTPPVRERTREEAASTEAHARLEAERLEKPGPAVSKGPFVAEVPPPFVPAAAGHRPIGRFRPHYLRRVAAVLVVVLLVVACAVVLVRLRDGDPVDMPAPVGSVTPTP